MKEISSRFEVLPVDGYRLTKAVRPSLRFKFELKENVSDVRGFLLYEHSLLMFRVGRLRESRLKAEPFFNC